MGFPTRWDYIFDKACKELSHHPDRLSSAWPGFVAEAHRSRLQLGADETQRLAEMKFWEDLFPNERFPEQPEDWESDALLAATQATTDPATNPANRASSNVNNLQYQSCWNILLQKAKTENLNISELLTTYKGRLVYCAENYLGESGQAVVQYRSELLTWRDLFEDDPFPGIDPLTGAPSLRTGKQVKDENGEDENPQTINAKTSTVDGKTVGEWQTVMKGVYLKAPLLVAPSPTHRSSLAAQQTPPPRGEFARAGQQHHYESQQAFRRQKREEEVAADRRQRELESKIYLDSIRGGYRKPSDRPDLFPDSITRRGPIGSEYGPGLSSRPEDHRDIPHGQARRPEFDERERDYHYSRRDRRSRSPRPAPRDFRDSDYYRERDLVSDGPRGRSYRSPERYRPARPRSRSLGRRREGDLFPETRYRHNRKPEMDF